MKLDFSNPFAPKRPPKSTEPPSTCDETGPAAKRPKTSCLPPPPEYSVCSPDTPSLCGQALKQYVETIASTRTQPIPFEDYLGKRLSAVHMEWYMTLLAARLNSDEKYPVHLDDLWPMLYSHKQHAVAALMKLPALLKLPTEDAGFLPTCSREQTSGRGGHNQKSYKLTLDCAQKFATEVPNAAGRAVRDFFLKVTSVTQEFMLIDSAIRGTQRERAEVEKNLLRIFDGEQDVVYLGYIQPFDAESDIYSMGHAKNIGNRIKDHRRKYGNFELVYAKKTPYKQSCEQAIFKHSLVAPFRDMTLVDGDIELFKVFRNDAAILSLKNTIDQVCREVCVAQGGVAHVTERQLPKTPEEMHHEERMMDREKEMLVLKHRHEVTMLKLKQQGGRKAGPDTHAVFEAQMERLARTSNPEDKWLPSLCAERADSMTDRDIKLVDEIAEKMGIDPSIITENELRARRLNHIYHYRYEGDAIYLSASGIVLWMDNKAIIALRDDEYAEEFQFSDTRTDIFSRWWDECTAESSRSHVTCKALLASYNAFRNVQNGKNGIKAFNKKLRESGIEVHKSIRTNSVLTDESGVHTGVKNRCLKTDHPSYQNIDWVYVEENATKKN